MDKLNLGTVVKVSWLEQQKLTKANKLLIIGDNADEKGDYYISVLYPYGLATKEIIKVYPCDIIEVVHEGFDLTTESKMIASLQ